MDTEFQICKMKRVPEIGLITLLNYTIYKMAKMVNSTLDMFHYN